MTPRVPLQNEWDELAAQIITVNISQQRRDELKRMFYAGAATLLSLIYEERKIDLNQLSVVAQELIEWGATEARIKENRKKAEAGGPMPSVEAEEMRKVEQFARTAFGALDFACDNVFQRRELGAALFVFSFAGPELTYISNAERADMIKMLHEFLAANPPAMTWDEQHG